MQNPVAAFVDQTDKLAKKHKAKVSIGIPGEKEVVIADHTGEPQSKEETVAALTNLIRNKYPILQGEKAALKTARGQLKEELLSRPDYKKADDAAKLAKEQLKTAKANAMRDPRIYEMAAKIKDKAAEVKDLQLSFSDFLVEWSDQTGQRQFDLGFGKPLKIKRTATL